MLALGLVPFLDPVLLLLLVIVVVVGNVVFGAGKRSTERTLDEGDDPGRVGSTKGCLSAGSHRDTQELEPGGPKAPYTI
jgi:hypothetical protein